MGEDSGLEWGIPGIISTPLSSGGLSCSHLHARIWHIDHMNINVAQWKSDGVITHRSED